MVTEWYRSWYWSLMTEGRNQVQWSREAFTALSRWLRSRWCTLPSNVGDWLMVKPSPHLLHLGHGLFARHHHHLRGHVNQHLLHHLHRVQGQGVRGHPQHRGVQGERQHQLHSQGVNPAPLLLQLPLVIPVRPGGHRGGALYGVHRQALCVQAEGAQ